jgi:hypothetical protein
MATIEKFESALQAGIDDGTAAGVAAIAIDKSGTSKSSIRSLVSGP